MIPIVQLIVTIASIFFGGKLTGMFGGMGSGASGDTPQGKIYVLADHPAATGMATTGSAATTSSTSAATPTTTLPGFTSAGPTTRTIIGWMTSNPWALFGGAALLLTASPFIGQLRAGFHEASGTVGEVYGEGQRQHRALNDTTRRSRRDR